MNHSKIAAALRALADAVEEGVEAVETAVTGKGKGKKTAAQQPAEPTAQQPAEPTAQQPAETTAQQPAEPSITLKQLNDAVLKVAAKNRDRAVAILGQFKLTTTVGLAADKWQAVYDAFEEEIAKIDAAAVQQTQASLV
jgi:hypothetical protein